jgi:hypothetical protein
MKKQVLVKNIIVIGKERLPFYFPTKDNKPKIVIVK